MKIRITTLSLTILCLALSVPAFGSALYDNGPTNGTFSTWFVDVGLIVSDTFVPTGSPMNGFTFAEWVPAGNTPLTVDWSIGTTSFGSQIGSGIASGANFSPVLLCSNGAPFNGGICSDGKGFDVYNTTVNTGPLTLTPGDTYYLTLTGATDNFGGRDGWDRNGGPSLAYHNLVGQIDSESFTITGGQPTTPEPSSMLLFGSGVLGLAGVLRRKLTR